MTTDKERFRRLALIHSKPLTIRRLVWSRNTNEYCTEYRTETVFGTLYVRRCRDDESDPWPDEWHWGWSFSDRDEGVGGISSD